MTAMRELADRLEAAAVAVVDLGEAINAGEPWPLAEVYGPGPESAWGPREVLAHTYLQEGKDWEAAERSLADVLALDPANQEARHNLEVLRRRRESAGAPAAQ